MPSTIRDLTELTAVAVDDYLVISDTSDVTNRDKRISRANLLGANITGGGAIATGGFTLTVPATGTASLLGTAQTYSALKTYGAGLSFGQSTLNYYEEGTWTPDLRFGGANTGVTYSTQVGTYTRMGRFVFAYCAITLSSKGSATGNAVIFGLPFNVIRSVENPIRWATMTTALVNMMGVFTAGANTITIDGLAATNVNFNVIMTNADFTNTSFLRFGGMYEMS